MVKTGMMIKLVAEGDTKKTKKDNEARIKRP